jgi:glycosyltransferase involved in cell wall biosynthesis
MNNIESIPKLSIVTVTLNAANHIQFLIDSLQNQTCKDFEWVVADGESKDGTVELISKAVGLNVSVVSAPDFGIYDAMNKCIKRARASHYLVIGADDTFEPHTVESIVHDLKNEPELDILIGQVIANGQLIKMQKGLSYIYGGRAYITGHSVGSVIRKSLHEKFGFYSNKYSIIADSAFIKKIFSSKELKAKYSDVVYGTFATGGVSNTAIVQSHCEFLSLQLATEKYKFFQILLFIARYAKFRFSKKL